MAEGTVYHLGPGDVNLAEDLTGQGHTTRVVGDVPRVSVTVYRDQSVKSKDSCGPSF